VAVRSLEWHWRRVSVYFVCAWPEAARGVVVLVPHIWSGGRFIAASGYLKWLQRLGWERCSDRRLNDY
jgi:hypothetical protein